MSCSLRFLLGHVAPPPTNMEHEVGRDALAPDLHTALGIERVLGAAKLVEKVEGFEAHGEHLLQERPGEGGVAHKVVGVHRRAVVAAPTVHLGVGGQLELPRQATVEGEAIVVLVDVERGEVGAVACAVAIGKMARGREVESVDAVGESQVLGVEEGAHGGPGRAFQQGLRRLAVRRGILHHIEVVVFLIAYARMGVEREPLLRVERAVEVGLLNEAPRRPTHVVEHLREGSRCGVVALALAYLVEGDGGAAVEREVLLALGHGGAQRPQEMVFTAMAEMWIVQGDEQRVDGGIDGNAFAHMIDAAHTRHEPQLVAMPRGVAHEVGIVSHKAVGVAGYGVEPSVVVVDAVAFQHAAHAHVEPRVAVALLLAVIGSQGEDASAHERVGALRVGGVGVHQSQAVGQRVLLIRPVEGLGRHGAELIVPIVQGVNGVSGLGVQVILVGRVGAHPTPHKHLALPVRIAVEGARELLAAALRGVDGLEVQLQLVAPRHAVVEDACSSHPPVVGLRGAGVAACEVERVGVLPLRRLGVVVAFGASPLHPLFQGELEGREHVFPTEPMGYVASLHLVATPLAAVGKQAAARGKRFAELGGLPLMAVVFQVGGYVLVPPFLLVVDIEVEASVYRLVHAVAKRLVGRPLAVLSGSACLVHVVGVDEGRDARSIGEAQAKEAPRVAVLGALGRLGVGHVALVVLAFEVHIHHEVFLLHLTPEPLALLGRLAIHLHVLHGIHRQVLEHHLVLALEEILAVEREEVYLLTIDQDGAVVFQLHARHLPHEGVEHRSVGQLEGRRVVDDGVVLVGHLDAGAFHHHLAQQVRGGQAVGGGGWLVGRRSVVGRGGVVSLHVMPRGVEVGVAARRFHLIVDKARLIVGMGHSDDVALRLARNGEAVVGVGAIVAACEIAAVGRVDNGAVGQHQGGLGATNGMVGHLVVHVAPEVDLPFLGRHSEGCTDHDGQ